MYIYIYICHIYICHICICKCYACTIHIQKPMHPCFCFLFFFHQADGFSAQVDGFTLNALLGALARGSQWRWALRILQGQRCWADLISGLERGDGTDRPL